MIRGHQYESSISGIPELDLWFQKKYLVLRTTLRTLWLEELSRQSLGTWLCHLARRSDAPVGSVSEISWNVVVATDSMRCCGKSGCMPCGNLQNKSALWQLAKHQEDIANNRPYTHVTDVCLQSRDVQTCFDLSFKRDCAISGTGESVGFGSEIESNTLESTSAGLDVLENVETHGAGRIQNRRRPLSRNSPSAT